MEEEWDNSQATERNVCMVVTCGDVLVGISQKESKWRGARRSSDTLSLLLNTMLRETS